MELKCSKFFLIEGEVNKLNLDINKLIKHIVNSWPRQKEQKYIKSVKNKTKQNSTK